MVVLQKFANEIPFIFAKACKKIFPKNSPPRAENFGVLGPLKYKFLRGNHHFEDQTIGILQKFANKIPFIFAKVCKKVFPKNSPPQAENFGVLGPLKYEFVRGNQHFEDQNLYKILVS